jgi:hypothetical protein
LTAALTLRTSAALLLLARFFFLAVFGRKLCELQASIGAVRV